MTAVCSLLEAAYFRYDMCRGTSSRYLGHLWICSVALANGSSVRERWPVSYRRFTVGVLNPSTIVRALTFNSLCKIADSN